MKRIHHTAAATWLVLAAATGALGQENPPPADPDAPQVRQLPADAVVAKVNGHEIQVKEVRRALAQALAGRRVTPDVLTVLQAQALDQVISRRLVFDAMQRGNELAGDEQVDAALAKVRAQLEKQKIDFQEFLKRQEVSESEWREQALWDVSWANYLASHRTDEALEKYFDEHRRDFDGTEIRVSHILLRADRMREPAVQQELLKKAADLRADIESGKVAFLQAAARYSSGPSRKQGGDLGFIPQRGRMVDTFADAAFALKEEELSQPVATQFGVHLILCTAVKPGDRAWRDVRDALEPVVTRAMFHERAQAEVAGAEIEFTGAIPYIDPTTRKLVLPGSEAGAEPLTEP